MKRSFCPSDDRKTVFLDGKWEFCRDTDDVGESKKWYSRFPTPEKMLNVPGCWNTEPELFGFFGIGWYSKEFTSEKKLIKIEFGAVSGEAAVWLDGEFLGRHYGGWTAFSFNTRVTPGVHRITVRVDGTSNSLNTVPLKRVDWFHYCGIIRPVSIDGFDAAYIDSINVGYTLCDELTTASVSLQLNIRDIADNASLPVGVTLGEDMIFNGSVTVKDGKAEIKSLKFENFELWDTDNPKLYTVTVSIPGDSLKERLGFRKIEIKNKKFYLNGKEIYFNGINRHEEHPDWGFAVPESVTDGDIALIKDIGCNIVRGSHYPPSQYFVDRLDEEGILFWCEIPMWGFPEEAMDDKLTAGRGLNMHAEMLSQYGCHPSVVIWGLHNECATNTDAGKKLSEMFYRYIKSHDADRLVTYATDKFYDDISLDYADFISLNYYFGWYKGDIDYWDEFTASAPEIAEKKGFGDKPLVMSEFGAGALYGFDDLHASKWSMRYQSDIIERVIRLCRENDRFCGTFVWQFANMRSDMDVSRVRGFNNKGILDEYRRPKTAYYTVKKLYNGKIQ